MTPTQVIEKAKDLETKSAQEIVAWALETYGDKIALASSFSIEDVAVIDMMMKVRKDARIFTLDTGRLNQETYDVMDAIKSKYDIKLEVMFPEREAVETMVREKGFNHFYDSIENRKECCKVRKVQPLRKMLSTLDGWITGLRSEQAVTRTDTPVVEIDEAFGGIAKVNPIISWSEEQTKAYIKENDVPYNALHDQGFPSIGCAPCTRAIKKGEDLRAGRWWWEDPKFKECGLHAKDA